MSQTFRFTVFLFLFSIPQAFSQNIYQTTDRFGSVKGTCLALIEDNRKILKSSGAFCVAENCVYEIAGNKVFKSSGVFCGFREGCVFMMIDNYFYEAGDEWGNFPGRLLYIVEGNRIYATINNFARGECLYILEDNRLYISFNPSGTMKDDCLLIIEGEGISTIALLAILARRF